VLGTAAYLSPEQTRGEPAEPGSDLYALGVVAYQLLAARLPYEAASLTDLARLQEAGPPPALDEINRDVPPALAEVVARSLARDRAYRFADAAEMEDALRDGLRGISHGGPDTDATHMLSDTEATRMITGTNIAPPPPPTRSTRRLQPIAEEPRRTPPPSRRTAPPPRKKSNAGRWLTLVFVLIVVVAGIFAYQALNNAGEKSVQTKPVTDQPVDQAVQSFKSLVDDNTQ
jgi:serine/threonine-protein kinase